MQMFNIGIDLACMMVTFVVFISVLVGKRSVMNRYFPTLLFLHTLTLLSDMLLNVYWGDKAHTMFLKMGLLFCVAFVMAETVGFNFYIDYLIAHISKKSVPARIIPLTLTLIGLVLWIYSLNSEFMFKMTEEGGYTFKPAIWILAAICAGIVIFDFSRVAINHISGAIAGHSAFGLYVFMMLPVIALVPAYAAESISIEFAAITIGYEVMYIAIHVKSESKSMEQQVEDTKKQTDLIISQLQPHFMFNSLAAIKYLCRTNPELADEAISKFSGYMRYNMESIKSDGLVLFADEMEHIKNYLWLEKVRFKDLRMEYSVDEDAFMVPRLSVQPIVENAVRHGLSKKLGGGTIKVSVRELEKCYKIIVKDTGLGFDVNGIYDPERKHSSINSIAARLKDMNDSFMEITSHPGMGTTVVFEIMKQEKG